MQANPLRAALERGEVQIGTWVNLVRNPAVLTLLKSAGLDFARVDMEHTAASMESIANMALLSRALNFPIAVLLQSRFEKTGLRIIDAIARRVLLRRAIK